MTETQVKVVLILLDDKGHAEWEVAKYLEVEDSNLNPSLKKLVQMKMIHQGEARISKKQKKKNGDFKEFPYYLNNNLDDLKAIVRKIAECKKAYDAGFVLRIFETSKYIKNMRKKFKRDVNKSVADVLRTTYPPYKDPFILEVIKPEFGGIICQEENFPKEGLRSWYYKYTYMLERHTKAEIEAFESYLKCKFIR